MSNVKERNYNFNSIGDLLDYKKYLESEIERCEKIGFFVPMSQYIYYVRFCYLSLKLVNYLIKKKGYNV